MKIVEPKVPVAIWQRSGGKDIVLNIGLTDTLIRFIILVFLPVLALLIDIHLVIYTAPVIAYLFITTLVRFCVVKYCWQHYISRSGAPALIDYGKDLNYPEETL